MLTCSLTSLKNGKDTTRTDGHVALLCLLLALQEAAGKKHFIGGFITGYLFNSMLESKRSKQMEKAINVLEDRQQWLVSSVKHVKEDMLTIAQTEIQDFEASKTAIEETNFRINSLATEVVLMEQVQKSLVSNVHQLHYAIFYLSFLFGNLFPAIERELSMYDYMIIRAEFLMDALDSLSTGHLSHKLVQPSDLQKLVDEVDTNIKNNFPEYTLVLKTVQEYYDMPRVRFQYANGKLVVQVPLYVQHYTQHPLDLYHLVAVPLPYNINLPPPQPYTLLHPTTPLLAMSYSTYIPLTPNQLHNCFWFGTLYLCEQTFLSQHHTQHTCELAIFHNVPHTVVQQLCNFTIYESLSPSPQILDSGMEILVANVPIPWTFHCAHETQVPPGTTGGVYVLIPKKSMCQCSISVGQYYIPENIVSCDNSSSQLKLHFTVNQAAIGYMPNVSMDLSKDIRLDNPAMHVLPDVALITGNFSDVWSHLPYMMASHMRRLMPRLVREKIAFSDKAAKNQAYPSIPPDSASDFWSTVLHTLLILLGIVIVVGLVALGVYCYCQHRRLHGTTTSLLPLWTRRLRPFRSQSFSTSRGTPPISTSDPAHTAIQMDVLSAAPPLGLSNLAGISNRGLADSECPICHKMHPAGQSCPHCHPTTRNGHSDEIP